jgi:hypothetical protein
MKLTIRFDIGFGPATITTTLATLVAWERKFKMKTSDLADNFGMEDMAFMAWHSAKIQTEHGQSIPVEFDSFVNKLVEIEIVSTASSNPTTADHTASL